MPIKHTPARRTVHLEDRPLPHDLGAEQGLLGCLAVSRSAFPTAREAIRPEHFHIGLHSKLFRLMCACYEAEAQSIDSTMLTEQLQAQGLLLEPVEKEYVARLVDSEPSALN